MKKILIAIFLVAVLIIAMGCIGAKEEKKEEATLPAGEEEEEVIEQTEQKVYACPLDPVKLDFTCETDDDCMLVKCEGGEGIVSHCVGTDAVYEGISSDRCICKVTGGYQTTYSNGTSTFIETKECRHTA